MPSRRARRPAAPSPTSTARRAVGETRRIATAFLPAVAIHVLLVLALGALLALGLDPEHRVLPVSLMTEPEPEPPTLDVRAPQAEPVPVRTVRKKKKTVAQPAETEEPSPVEEAGPAFSLDQGEQPPPPSPPAVQPAPGPVAEEPPAPTEPKAMNVDKALAQIRAKLQKNLLYPPVARLNSLQGTVRVRFEIESSGQPLNVKIVESSGFEVLDKAAVKTVLASAPLPVVPLKVKVPVVFKLD